MLKLSQIANNCLSESYFTSLENGIPPNFFYKKVNSNINSIVNMFSNHKSDFVVGHMSKNKNKRKWEKLVLPNYE